MKIFFKNPRRIILAVIIFSYILLLFFFPVLCIEGAKNGLLLWFEQLLPSLLPFLILSGLCVRFGLTDFIGKLFYPFFRFLPISKQGCYPIVIGFLSGYPVGAKTCADMLIEKKLTKREASFLLCLCNNASPMFLTGFTACNCLGLPKYRYLIFFIIVISGLFSALLLYPFLFKHMPETYSSTVGSITESAIENKKILAAPSSAIQKLDETILSGFEVMVKIGGYIILFSIPATLFSALFSYLFSDSNQLSVFLPAIVLGTLEISTGVSFLGSAALPFLTKIVLTLSVCAFGGFSALAQTKSVIGSSGLSIRYYLLSKILQSIFAAGISFLLFSFKSS